MRVSAYLFSLYVLIVYNFLFQRDGKSFLRPHHLKVSSSSRAFLSNDSSNCKDRLLSNRRLHCKKKSVQYGMLRLSHLEHLIWCEVMPNFWCVLYAKLGVLSHQLSVLSHLTSVFFSHSL